MLAVLAGSGVPVRVQAQPAAHRRCGIIILSSDSIPNGVPLHPHGKEVVLHGGILNYAIRLRHGKHH